MKKTAILFFLFFFGSVVFAQRQNSISNDSILLDTSTVKEFSEINISQKKNTYFLPRTYGTLIFSGKKSEIIHLDKSYADLSLNNARQVFSKVPGLVIWEMMVPAFKRVLQREA